MAYHKDLPKANKNKQIESGICSKCLSKWSWFEAILDRQISARPAMSWDSMHSMSFTPFPNMYQKKTYK